MKFLKLKKELSSKKIIILGFSEEGIDTFIFLRKLFPDKVIGVGDKLENLKLKSRISNRIKKDRNIVWHLGKNYLKSINKYDLIIKSPGIPFVAPEIRNAFKQGKITSQTEIFLKYCPGTVIGITGTKGKGTTSSLIYRILKKEKKRVFLVGNIGNPSLAFLIKAKPKDIFIYEMSSHQLLGLKQSPNIAVFLNIFPAHLDYYKNFKEYFSAKKPIFLYQKKNNILIYNKDDKLVKNATKVVRSKKISFSMQDKNSDCYLSEKYIFYKGKKIMEISDFQLAGKFNLTNLMPGIIIGDIFNISRDNLINAVKSFKGLPYRLEFVGKYRGIEFYNDSLATVPEASASSIEAFGDRVKTLIAGGFDSGLHYEALAKKISKNSIENLILFPPIGKNIASLVKKYSINRKNGKKIQYFHVDNMKEAILLSFKHTSKEGICLLSPGAPSFGVFRDYKERGDLFKKYVRIYAR